MIDSIRAELDYRQERVRRDAVTTRRDARRDAVSAPKVVRPTGRRPRPVR
ncbi:hypothetical protein [Jiangella alba]|uniref:Uncharacterized protein n=1 Tax=Jiangella alba TaxID=561176 RepID=A0A1H5HX87_9ACTN|nr:hypothetical protein [Jiangella alba]SEE31848.1 hypothetical protein SAMN04488561_0974 [Jiangella alba]